MLLLGVRPFCGLQPGKYTPYKHSLKKKKKKNTTRSQEMLGNTKKAFLRNWSYKCYESNVYKSCTTVYLKPQRCWLFALKRSEAVDIKFQVISEDA